jgi:hypothetical protein
MPTAYLIADRSSGIASYYSAEVSRKLGVPNGGWSQEPKRALAFARRQDADEFRKTFLLTIGEMADIIEHVFVDPPPKADPGEPG